MTCPQCGVDNAPNSAACHRCGVPLDADTPPSRTFEPAPSREFSGAPSPAPPTWATGKGYRRETGPGAPRSGGPIVAVILLAGCALFAVTILAAILFPVFAKARERAQIEVCMEAGQRNAMALFADARIHGGRLASAYFWEDAVAARLGPNADTSCPKATVGSGFMMNAALSGRPITSISDPARTVLLFEGGDGRNLSGGPQDAKSHHGRRITVVFADGRTATGTDVRRLKWSP